MNDAKERIELRVHTKHTYHETERWLRSVSVNREGVGFSDITIKKETIFLNDKQWKNNNQRSRFCFEVEKRSKR